MIRRAPLPFISASISGTSLLSMESMTYPLKNIEEQFNAWAKETCLPCRHLSLICAMSIAQNYEGDRYGGDVIGGGPE